MCKRIVFPLVAVLTLSLAAVPARSGTLTVYPEKLTLSWKSIPPGYHVRQTGTGVYVDIPADDYVGVPFWAPVRLPVGTRLTSLSYKHLVWGQSRVRLVRAAEGTREGFAVVATAATDPAQNAPQTPAVSFSHTVAAGWRYFLEVWVRGQEDSGVGKIFLGY